MNVEPAERTAVETSDFEEAVASLRREFGGVDMRRADDEPSRFALRSLRVSDVRSTRWTFRGVTGGSRVDRQDDPVLLTGVIVTGAARLWSPAGDIDTTRPFLYPDAVDSRLDRPDLANLGIARSVVAERARAITGIDDFEVEFGRTAPVDQVMDAVWRDTMAYAARTAAALVDHPDAEIARTALVDLTATLLLRTFPNTTMDAANQRTVTGPRRTAIRRALQYIDDHLDQAITVPDIARAARLSTRGLFAGFQRDLDMTPMAYLRAARLSAVRDELRHADPAVTSVMAVAARWGFVDGTRFAHRYAEAFGEPPATTLRG